MMIAFLLEWGLVYARAGLWMEWQPIAYPLLAFLIGNLVTVHGLGGNDRCIGKAVAPNLEWRCLLSAKKNSLLFSRPPPLLFSQGGGCCEYFDFSQPIVS